MTLPIIKREHVQLSVRSSEPEVAPVTLIHKSGDKPVHGQKAVRLLETEGRVHAIEFTCSCCEVTAVELTYPAEAASK